MRVVTYEKTRGVVLKLYQRYPDRVSYYLSKVWPAPTSFDALPWLRSCVSVNVAGALLTLLLLISKADTVADQNDRNKVLAACFSAHPDHLSVACGAANS